MLSGGDVEKMEKLEELENSVEEIKNSKQNIEEAFDWNIINQNLTNTDLLVTRFAVSFQISVLLFQTPQVFLLTIVVSKNVEMFMLMK